MENAFWVYVTAPNIDLAEQWAKRAVVEKLAACGNYWGGMKSVYHWKGQLEQSDEAVLVLKTSSEKLELLTEKLKEWHSYNCPCVLALPIAGGNADFVQWIHEQVQLDGPR